jgi:hypothetical protein
MLCLMPPASIPLVTAAGSAVDTPSRSIDIPAEVEAVVEIAPQ